MIKKTTADKITAGITDEELFVYAVFSNNGFDVEDEYNKLLDTLFLENPENEDYLELETFSGNMRKSVPYIFTHSDTKSFDIEKFGKVFVDLFHRYYESVINEFCNCRNKSEQFALEEFAELSYDIWNFLPEHIQMKEPFDILLYADEPLSYGNIEQSKELYQRIFDYYK